MLNEELANKSEYTPFRVMLNIYLINISRVILDIIKLKYLQTR
jgi:hypothetical protein